MISPPFSTRHSITDMETKLGDLIGIVQAGALHSGACQ
jgi:hypothetical protein